LKGTGEKWVRFNGGTGGQMRGMAWNQQKIALSSMEKGTVIVIF
jgi:hypothetical protein